MRYPFDIKPNMQLSELHNMKGIIVFHESTNDGNSVYSLTVPKPWLGIDHCLVIINETDSVEKIKCSYEFKNDEFKSEENLTSQPEGNNTFKFEKTSSLQKEVSKEKFCFDAYMDITKQFSSQYGNPKSNNLIEFVLFQIAQKDLSLRNFAFSAMWELKNYDIILSEIIAEKVIDIEIIYKGE